MPRSLPILLCLVGVWVTVWFFFSSEYPTSVASQVKAIQSSFLVSQEDKSSPSSPELPQEEKNSSESQSLEPSPSEEQESPEEPEETAEKIAQNPPDEPTGQPVDSFREESTAQALIAPEGTPYDPGISLKTPLHSSDLS
jgi:cytoskeletal protein RodZ